MSRWQRWRFWKTAFFCALAAVIGLASPAAALEPSTTSVTATPSTAAVGAPVELDATVSCPEDPSGGLGVSFFDGPDLLATVPVAPDGTATYDTTFATTGTHTITAAYNGNDNCAASNDEATVTVSSSPTPPDPPYGFCVLACGGVINFTVGNIDNDVVVY
ncbi:Ig-like domain-containing protein [Streptomyces sp. CMB-StM0423]|uniref:Ig-like domain-containing protein n=1 Tax=Streptomyces sp. CMB-StM0423 TaxID=2059884 RepID=UPI0018FE3649|nr:Ig-like domain-containing protein [Streptomyces sp. CMB-StM0423]